MNDGNLITLSKVDAKSNNHVERKSFTNVDIATSVAFALFVGTTALKSTADLDALFGYDFIMPSYIQYINLNTKKGHINMYVDKTIDLMKVGNLNKIEKMAVFDDDWNGTGGSIFSKKAIKLFKMIIEMLEKQPEIAPTGRNSLLMQYELDDKSLLVFEVSEEKTEKVYIPKGDYSMAQMELFTENTGYRIKECVEKFYGLE